MDGPDGLELRIGVANQLLLRFEALAINIEDVELPGADLLERIVDRHIDVDNVIAVVSDLRASCHHSQCYRHTGNGMMRSTCVQELP